jgi:hypothetical protein
MVTNLGKSQRKGFGKAHATQPEGGLSFSSAWAQNVAPSRNNLLCGGQLSCVTSGQLHREAARQRPDLGFRQGLLQSVTRRSRSDRLRRYHARGSRRIGDERLC